MASQDEAMGGESSSDPLSQDEEDDEPAKDDKDNDSSSLSSDDSIESDLESESFTDVTPLHSISNSPLPTQPIAAASQKLRDSIGGTDEENSGHSSDDDEDDDSGGKGTLFGRPTRRATVKRAPGRTGAGVASVSSGGSVGSGGGEVSNLSDAIQKLDIQQDVRSRRMREQERRLDTENEHLLKRIIAQKSRVAEYVVSTSPHAHVASSSINRKRQQKYIHAQNLALHKRIEAARNGCSGSTGVFGGVTGTGSPRKPSHPPQRQRHDTR